MHPVREDLCWFVGDCRPRRLRSMFDFVESEIVVPDGKYAGQRFRTRTQPFSGLVFRAIDAGRPVGADGETAGWRRIILVGPTQSGKTLCGFVVPLMYHLFETVETVLCVVPDIDMVDDKWQKDIRPVIHASRFRSLLPVRGEGSRGGKVRNTVTFTNGASIKFMTTGGDDTKRAAFTARVAVVTELNAFGKRKASSDEADMWRQVQGRLKSYGDQGVIYGECTVTTEKGLVWTEYEGGTCSRIVMPCGYCGEYVTLGREHLVGWEDAGSEIEAERLSRWVCPACGVIWAPGDRERFARGSVLVHRDQRIVKVEE